MIRHLRGEYLSYDRGAIVIETSSGIGFRIMVPDNSPLLLKREGDIVSTFTYLNVKEDSLSLFGFHDEDSLRLFEQLISISGVGPKAGISIMALADVNTIKSYILNGDAKSISKASGIGKKTSERIILELSEKIEVNDDIRNVINVDSIISGRLVLAKNEAILALTTLGYSKTEATTYVESIKDNDLTTEAYIKLALKNLM
ncbi:MAG: Holliday junction branch migration protein RuvA [Peptostreptococcaceae bacterium]|nr:Holliday junction branch migration protein RuvA [Peptostreptococcaceae bacterium]